jgi:hypothetical protein
MKKLSEDQVAQLFEAGYELRNTEHKPPFDWNSEKATWVKEKVIRAILSMTNTRYGGKVVVGVEVNDDRSINLKGVSDKELKSFDDYDGIKGAIDGFSFTNTDFDINWCEHEHKKYVVFTIQEFAETPAICRKSGSIKGVLVIHDMYTRSKKAPYSSIKATDAELREIIHMAVDKEKTDLKSRGWVKKSTTTPEDFYRKQIKDLT